MLNFEIVIPTTLTREEFDKTGAAICIRDICNIYKSKTSGIKVTLNILFENREGLSSVYAQRLQTTKADYVICMHDDFEVHDFFMFRKLIKAHEIYDIVGLAGASSQDYSNPESPPVWHRSCGRNEGRGIVGHYIPAEMGGFGYPYVNSVEFGPTPAPVVVIDGLFMSFRMDKVRPQLPIFDPQFTFHFYDLAAACNATRKGLTLGVWPIYGVHHGLGEYAHDETWQKLAVEFRAKHSQYKHSV